MDPRSRRLAAIMFTDMVGYSALAQSDEPRALATLAEHNRLLRPVFARFGGREIKTVGDAFLVEFESALSAVQCALEVQRALDARNREAAEPNRFRVRIGIHVGDVIRSNGDVLGDAVNIASRIEPLAEPGGVCLTQQVYDQVRNKLPTSFVRLPPANLKNIRTPVVVYRAVPAGRSSDGAVARPMDGHQLAVLPLHNISPDPNDAYFADGLTEELISVLSQVHGLEVIARTSVEPYRTAPKPIADVGVELGVDTVLEGSVRKAGTRIRITLQLVDAHTQRHIWATSYNRELDDVFEVQSDIAKRTAEALELELARTDRPSVERKATANLAAYDAYLRGLVATRAARHDRYDEAIRYFQQATTLDPEFADAYAAWADLYVSAAGDRVAVRAVMPRARELAARALELDPESSDAHSALGNIALQFDHDWARAEAEFQRALALNPSNPRAHHFYGMLLMALGRYPEAKDLFLRASRIDPVGPFRSMFAWAELAAGEWDAALRFMEAEVERDPSDLGNHAYLGLFYLEAGRRDDAMREAKLSLPAATDEERFDHALLNALLGRPGPARALLAEAERGEAHGYVSVGDRAMLHAALGDRDRALDELEKEWREEDMMLWLFYRGVWFDAIRDDARFVALLREYGLPEGPPRRGRG
jgi:adenylate cyclase